MITSFDPDDALRVCNSILTRFEQRSIVRAAYAAHADKHQNAEGIRAAAGYGRSDMVDQVKT